MMTERRRWVGMMTLMGFDGDPHRSNRRMIFDLDSLEEIAVMNYHMGPWTPEMEANFNLLLAAPKLLAACRAYISAEDRGSQELDEQMKMAVKGLD
jgi:hypothetical protein